MRAGNTIFAELHLINLSQIMISFFSAPFDYRISSNKCPTTVCDQNVAKMTPIYAMANNYNKHKLRPAKKKMLCWH